MLLGEFRCAAGERLTIPAELRVRLGEQVTLTRGIERCLFIYPAQEWSSLAEKMRGLPLTNPNARAFIRLVCSGAVDCVPDAQGCIPLPDALRRYAGIEDEAIIVGLDTHLEVWSPPRWQEITAEMEKDAASVVERLSVLGKV